MNKYSNNDFFEERDELLNNGGIPSAQFCSRFKRRLPELSTVNKAGYHNDHEDYHAWGKALFDDIDKDAQAEIDDLNLWDWIDFWEAISTLRKNHYNDSTQKSLIEAIMNLAEAQENGRTRV